jgi:Tn3 transposase DDE domain
MNYSDGLFELQRALSSPCPSTRTTTTGNALCLQILVNAVQVWNARYMTASIEHLHITKPDVVVANEDALARIAPVTHAHVNSLGRYELNRQLPPRGQPRPLRPADHDTDRSIPTPPLGISGDKH